MSLGSKIDKLAGVAGIESILVESGIRMRRGDEKWHGVLDSALALFKRCDEKSIRLIVGSHTIAVLMTGDETVAVAVPTGHTVMKSIRRMLVRAHRSASTPKVLTGWSSWRMSVGSRSAWAMTLPTEAFRSDRAWNLVNRWIDKHRTVRTLKQLVYSAVKVGSVRKSAKGRAPMTDVRYGGSSNGEGEDHHDFDVEVPVMEQHGFAGGVGFGAAGETTTAVTNAAVGVYKARAESKRQELVDLGDRIRGSRVGQVSPETILAHAEDHHIKAW